MDPPFRRMRREPSTLSPQPGALQTSLDTVASLVLVSNPTNQPTWAFEILVLVSKPRSVEPGIKLEEQRQGLWR